MDTESEVLLDAAAAWLDALGAPVGTTVVLTLLPQPALGAHVPGAPSVWTMPPPTEPDLAAGALTDAAAAWQLAAWADVAPGVADSVQAAVAERGCRLRLLVLPWRPAIALRVEDGTNFAIIAEWRGLDPNTTCH